MLRTGIDLVEISRLNEALQRHQERFLARIFTPQEREQAGESAETLAGRFAAKEAVSKALGTGIGQVSWQEIEILRGPLGEPLLNLHGAAQEAASNQGLEQWSISISHSQTHAVAVAVAMGPEGSAANP